MLAPVKHLITVLFAVALLFGDAVAVFAQEISYNRDVRPILSDRCFACHGQDTKDRKAKLRLDRATGVDGAYRTRDGSTAIKPGSLAKSELWYRINTNDPDDIMPPPKARKRHPREARIVRRGHPKNLESLPGHTVPLLHTGLRIAVYPRSVCSARATTLEPYLPHLAHFLCKPTAKI